VVPPGGGVEPAGNVTENVGKFGQFTLTSGVTVNQTRAVSGLPPMFWGRRRIAANVGVPDGCVVLKTIARCEMTLVGGHPIVLFNCAPNGPIGPSVAEVVFETLVTSVVDALPTGPGVGVGVGVAAGRGRSVEPDWPPPLQATTEATRASTMRRRRSIVGPPSNATRERPFEQQQSPPGSA